MNPSLGFQKNKNPCLEFGKKEETYQLNLHITRYNILTYTFMA